MEKVRIAIMGAGGISSRVAQGIKESKNCIISRVVSRDLKRAKTLADKFEVLSYSDNYSDAFLDDIDAVYITTINELHYAHIRECILHRKHVICEKPMLVDFNEVKELYDLAREYDVMLLEAMKCRYLPTVTKVKEILKDLPKPHYLTATFCRDEWFARDENHWFFNPTYGGAFKDIGCYVLSWVFEIFPAEAVEYNLQQLFGKGIDIESWLYVKNEEGLFMQLGCGVNYNADNMALICGDDYQIKVRDFWKSYNIEVYKKQKLVREYKEDIGSEFSYQVDYFGEIIKKAAWSKTNATQILFLERIISFYPTSK